MAMPEGYCGEPLASRAVAVTWSDDVDEILASDLAAGVAYLTPAKGVVIVPMAPLGIRDRETGTVTVSTSQGLWRKLERIRRNPGVAIAYHAREHGLTDRPGFVLVQGRASFPLKPDREWLESITPEWDRFLGPRSGGPLGRMLDVYYWQRVPITVQVERIVAYPDNRAEQDPIVFGTDRAEPPPPQKAPRRGTGPRVDTGAVENHAARLPHTLLAWCGSDDLPEVIPVAAAGSSSEGVNLRVSPGAVPPSGRRAGLTSHWFLPRMIGQEQRVHTGWVSSDGAGRVVYAPHTKTGYRLPKSRALYMLACASLATRMRDARKAGVVG
jgi:hypothetical protein